MRGGNERVETALRVRCERILMCAETILVRGERVLVMIVEVMLLMRLVVCVPRAGAKRGGRVIGRGMGNPRDLQRRQGFPNR